MKKHVLPVVVLHAHLVGLAAQEVVKDVEEHVKVVVEVVVLAIVVEVAKVVVVGAEVDVKLVVAIWRKEKVGNVSA